MRVQAYEGYVEGGQFYPIEKPISLDGRFRAVLTVLDIPMEEDVSVDWVDDLINMIQEDTSEKLRVEDFPRMDLGRNPVIFSDGR